MVQITLPYTKLGCEKLPRPTLNYFLTDQYQFYYDPVDFTISGVRDGSSALLSHPSLAEFLDGLFHKSKIINMTNKAIYIELNSARIERKILRLLEELPIVRK